MRKICTLSFLLLATVFTVIGLNHQSYREKASAGFTKFKDSAQKLKKYIDEEPVIIAASSLEAPSTPIAYQIPAGPLILRVESKTKYESHHPMLPQAPPV